MLERAETDGRYLNFIGAGAYEHHIPAAVWQITTRGEFYSSIRRIKQKQAKERYNCSMNIKL